jgi:hypothetical protein
MNLHVPVASVAASADNRAKFFGSCSRKDLAFARILVRALAEHGSTRFSIRTLRRAGLGRNSSHA